MVVLKFVLFLILGLGSVFLILLVLIQKGRGGGLAGALGGMGGSSAFGARAGDTFTRITIGAAAVWIICAMALARIRANEAPAYIGPNEDPPAVSSEDEEEKTSGLGVPDDDKAKGDSKAGKSDTSSGDSDLVPPELGESGGAEEPAKKNE